MLVQHSLMHCLWSSPSGDMAEQQLASPSGLSLGDDGLRGQRMRLYARAVNEAFVQVSTACGTVYMLLSEIVILQNLEA